MHSTSLQINEIGTGYAVVMCFSLIVVPRPHEDYRYLQSSEIWSIMFFTIINSVNADSPGFSAVFEHSKDSSYLASP